MSFNEESLLPASDKFYMARFQGCRLLTAANTTYIGTYVHSISGATMRVYEATVHTFLKVKEFTHQAGGISTDHVVTELPNSGGAFPHNSGVAPYYNVFYYSAEDGYMRFALNGSSAPLSSLDCVSFEYYLFFTEFTGKRALSNMIDGDEVYWSPRLPKDPKINFSQANNLMATLSISTSAIELKNQDLYFNSFFGEFDSFNNRELKVWRCINDVSNFQFELSCIVRGAGLNEQEASFQLEDSLAMLDSTCYFGFETYKTYSDLHDFTDYWIRSQDLTRPIYRSIGKVSPYDTLYINTAQSLQVRRANPSKMIPAVCAFYDSSTKTVNTNRAWSCGFGPANANAASAAIGSLAHYTNGTYSASVITLSTHAASTFSVGDSFHNNGTQYGLIVGVSGNDVEVWPYNASLATGTITRGRVSSVVVVKDDIKYYPVFLRDYLCQMGPHGDIQIFFANNFEANHSGLAVLDPDTCEVFTKFWNESSDTRSSTIAKSILTEAEIPCSSTFMPNQIDYTWVDPDLSFCIPYVGGSDFPTCKDILDKVLKSSLSFVYFDNVGEMRYKSFLDTIKTPGNIHNQSGQDSSDSMMSSNTAGFSTSFDLYDQFVGTSFKFNFAPQYDNFYAANPEAYTLTDFRALKLYRTNKYYGVESLLDTHDLPIGLVTYAVLEAYNNLIMGRRCVFSLTAFSRHFRLYIGDDILVSRKDLVGNESEVYLRVIASGKGSNDVDYKLIDQKNFPT